MPAICEVTSCGLAPTSCCMTLPMPGITMQELREKCFYSYFSRILYWREGRIIFNGLLICVGLTNIFIARLRLKASQLPSVCTLKPTGPCSQLCAPQAGVQRRSSLSLRGNELPRSPFQFAVFLRRSLTALRWPLRK